MRRSRRVRPSGPTAAGSTGSPSSAEAFRATRVGGDRKGLALLAVVLVSLALLLAAHAALLMADTEALVSVMERRRLTGTHAARAALRAFSAGLDSLPGTGPSETPWGPVEVVPLSPEVRFLRAGDASRGEAAARLLYAPDPSVRSVSRTHAVRVAGTTFRGGPVFDPGPLPGDVCPDGSTDPMGGRWTLPGPPPDGPTGIRSDWPGIGPLTVGHLLARLPRIPPGELALPEDMPDPAACPPWGDSARPTAACGGRFGAAAVSGDLSIAGRGQGFLVVEGDLALDENAEFRGWLVVSGDLRLRPGARFSGLADAAGDLFLEGGSILVGDRCSGLKALASVAPLREPWSLGPSGWPVPPR